jgi:RHS repeat-associated protein
MHRAAATILFVPSSPLHKLLSMLLVWAMVMSSMPAYSLSTRRAKWTDSPRFDVGTIPVADPPQSTGAAAKALSGREIVTRRAALSKLGQKPSTRLLELASLSGQQFTPIRNGMLFQSGQSGISSIVSNFNGTAIPAGNAVWFSSVVKVSGMTGPTRVFLRAAAVQFSVAGTTYNLPVPDATITFTPTAGSATTIFDSSKTEWITNVPSGLGGNTFLAGVTFRVPAGGLPGGINPVTWSGTFYSDSSTVSINWQWAAAVYTSFGTDYRALGVKPVDDNLASQYNNSDHSGTPEAYKTFVTGGARGGGGSNFTGSYSGTGSVIPINQVPNYPPVGNAGPDQTAHVTDVVHLDGTASSDRDGDALTYRWSFVSVPASSSAALSGSTTAQPTFTVDRPGSYTTQLIVNDGKVDSSPATVTVTTINSPPVANAGPNQTVFVNSIVHLDGSASTDVDGNALTYRWSLITVPVGSAAQLSDSSAVNPTFTADVKGVYVAQLIVNDGQVDSTPATVTITTENSPPVANAGPNETLQAGRTVNLDGSKSSDVDGDALTFRWSILSFPDGSNATLSNATSVRPSFFGDKIGTYVVQLIVNDGTIDSTPATVTITTENTAPVASAGPNQSVFVGNTVTLDGSHSNDVDGDSITYRWALLSIPTNSAAQLSDPTVVNPTFVVDVKGTYVAQLIVNDGFVDSIPATVTISTLNSPPVANAGPAQTVLAGTTVQLNGSKSTDVDGDALTFKWSITSKPSNSNAVLSDPASVTPTFFADQLGVYVVQLIVNDGTVDSTPSTVTITTEDSPPIANAGPAQTVPLGALVTLDGSGSSDPDGQALTYQWSLLSVPPGSTAVLANPTSVHPTFTADRAGNYVVQLIVNDGFLSSQPSTVTISTINSVPVANAGPNQSVRTGTTVQLDGSGSSDADGDPLTYRWSITVKPSGSSASLSDPTAVKPTFVADLAGNYVAQLIVNDGKVDSPPATVMIVAVNPNQPPVVNAGPNLTVTLPTNTVTLNGTATDDGLPSGILTITWSEVSGPAPVTFSSPNTAVTQATFTTVGTYVLRLTATDTEFTVSSDVTVVVSPAPINQPPVVNAGPGGSVTIPGVFALHGSATDDGLPSGILRVQWTQISGPSTAVFANAAQAATSVSIDSPGVYALRLTASDGQLSASSDVTVVGLVNNGGGNQPPFVNAGPDQIIALPNPAVLNGLAFDDGLPNGTLTITWSVVSGPGAVVFADPSNPKTTATFAVAGDYVLRLTADDSQLSSSSDVRIIAGQLNGTRSSKGTEFWLMFGEVLGSTPSIFITSETNASGTVSVPGINFSQNFTVAAAQITSVTLPTSVLATGSENIQNIGIHVVADHEVTVYGLNFEPAATDAYLGLPVTALGKEYINASYINVGIINGTEFGVVAPYDNTTVTVTPSQTTGGRTVGVPYSFVLHQGRTYQLRNTNVPGDLTGSIITSDKPVAVFGMHQCADIRGQFCNHLVEQLPSTDTWGTHFVSVPLATRKNGDTFRIIGAKNGTNVSINGQQIATVNRGEFYETLITAPSYIVSDQPILLVQYSNSTTFDNSADADPFMIVVPPIEQYRASYTVTTMQPSQFLINFINVVIPTSAKAALQLDGVPVAASAFTDVANSGFSTAQLSVGTGAHRLVANAPFGVFVYGFASFDGYGYTGGIALAGVPGGNLGLVPATSTQAPNTHVCSVASVTDADQHALPAVNVNFTVTGANPQSASVDTDNNGQAPFCYTGTNTGTDSIIASIGTSTAAASVTWQAAAGNQAPQVFVPQSLNVSRPASLVLPGVVVDDGLPLGGALTQQWSQVSGAGTATFTTPTAAVSKVTFSIAGDYVLQLSASDTQLSSSASVTIHVTDSSANKAPVITPLPTQTLDFNVNPAGTMTLSPTVTDDGLPVGSILAYNWTMVGGSTNLTIVNPTSGSTPLVIKDSGSNQSFTLRLTADDSRLSSSMNVTINTITANRAPTVSPGSGGTITLPTNTFTLNGSVTDDGKPAGSTLTVQWQLQSGPAPVTFSSPNTAVTSVTFQNTPGFYVFRLSASDGQLTSSNSVQVTVNPANKAPVVSIPFVPAITLPTNVVTLNGSVTDDGLPSNALNISWVQISGPASVVFSAPNQPVTQATFSTSGSYTLQLRADDTQLQTTANVTVQVNPANKAPVVSAGPNQTIALPTNTVTLTGTVTDDGLPSGATVTQQWSQVSGPAAVTFSAPTQKTTNATFSIDGTYVLQLTASDTQLSSSSSVTITVLPTPQNLPPVVSAGLNQVGTLPSPTTSLQLFLSGSVKDDGLPVGKPVTQQWSVVSGPAAVTFTNPLNPTTFATFSVAGTYVLQLTASDTQLTSSATVTILVNPPINQPPNVIISVPGTVSLPTTTATLTGTVSDDGLPNGTLTVQWTQISGPAGATISAPTSAITQVNMPVAGSYTFQLAASDSALTTTRTGTITVTSNQPPTVNIAAAATAIFLPQSAGLTANAADDGKPNGTLLYQWSQTSGPAPVSFSTPTAPTTQVFFTNPGTYTIQILVSDTQLSTTSTISLTVNPTLPPLSVGIISPPDGDAVTQPVSVTANVSNGNSNWKLEYSLSSGNDGTTPNWVQFASGSGQEIGAVLGTFDPTALLNGTYTIRLSATDANGQSATSSVAVSVEKNIKVGDLQLAFNDLTVPLPGLPIQIIRSYDSRDKRQGDFGFSWTLSLVNLRLEKNRNLGRDWTEDVTVSNGFPTYCLTPNNDRFVTVTFPDGKVYKFQTVAGPQCQRFAPITAPQLQFQQVPTGPGTFGATLATADGADLLIDGSVPGPQDIVDFNLNIYNPTLFKFTTAEGFTYIIDQNLGVTSVTDPSGNKITINANGITSSNGPSVAFQRDAQNRITQITDATGQNVLKYGYNTSGDLATFTDQLNNVTHYNYVSNHFLNSIQDARNITVFQALFDSTGHLTSTTDGLGHQVRFTHDIAGHHETITDRLNNPTTYDYDNDGNITRITDALGHVSTATFDANDNKLTETNALGKTTSYSYDAAGNRLTTTDPLGNVARYTYNGKHQLLSVTDPSGHVINNTYDLNGNLLTGTDAQGNVTTYTYNAQGNPLTVKDALGKTTRFVYDGNGRMTQETDTLGNTISFTYDTNGNRLTQSITRTKADGTTETLTTQYQYDVDNRLVKTANPNGTFTQTAYNPIGKPSDVFDALNRKTHHDYDNNGRLSRTTYPDLTTESVTYDGNDHRLTVVDRLNRTTSFTYDALGRLTKTTYPDLTFSQTGYDAIGRTIQTIDALNHSTSYGYDDAGRRTSVTDALGNVTSFAYDNAGNEISITDALNHTTRFVYDNSNRRIQTIHPDQSSDSVTYDVLGRQIAKTDQPGEVQQYGYDSVGRLSTVTQFLNGSPLTTTYGYDEVGNRISQTDANGHTTHFAYDQLGHLTSRTLPLNMSETYGYDAVGNLNSKKDFNGRTTTYQYDSMNRLKVKTADSFFSTGACAGGLCGATQITYSYDSLGRRTSMVDASGTTTYTYDTRDRLLTKASPAGTLTYTYNAAGNALTLKSSNTGGASMTYTYDVLNRLASVTDASGATSYTYDAVGNLAGFTYPNGVQTSYNYDALNRLTQMQATCGTGSGCGTPGTAISSYAYTLGPAGHRLSVAELSGRSVNYVYDDLYRLTSETISGAASQNGAIGYQYDAVGNRLQRNSSVPAIPATGLLNYDANDRTASDPYDSNGNLLNGGGGSNVYDFENRLVQAGGVKLVYDGDGNRVQETVAGVTTKYLVADQNSTGYAQVMDELQGTAVTRTYSYGLELTNERQTIFGAPTTSFYGYDGHGSVRFLTDSTGAIIDSYDYDAFGNLIAQTGSTPNNYLFAGEQFDPALGVYYNRARYYDQRQGRFWTMDTNVGDPGSPASLHRYLYVGADPPNGKDPSGFQADLVELGVAESASLTVFGLSTFSSQIVIGAVLGGLLNASLSAGVTALKGGSPEQIRDATASGALWGVLLGAAGGAASAFTLGKIVLGLAGLGLGGYQSYGEYRQGNYGIATLYAALAVGSAVLSFLSLRSGIPVNQQSSPTSSVGNLFRYISDGELDAAARNGGRLPNVNQFGQPRDIPLTTEEYSSSEAAEDALLMGAQNPGGATTSPAWGVEVSSDGLKFTYAGNSATNGPLELRTPDGPLILRIWRLR